MSSHIHPIQLVSRAAQSDSNGSSVAAIRLAIIWQDVGMSSCTDCTIVPSPCWWPPGISTQEGRLYKVRRCAARGSGRSDPQQPNSDDLEPLEDMLLSSAYHIS